MARQALSAKPQANLLCPDRSEDLMNNTINLHIKEVMQDMLPFKCFLIQDQLLTRAKTSVAAQKVFNMELRLPLLDCGRELRFRASFRQVKMKTLSLPT